MSLIEQTCKCGKKYFARESDLKRGWGKSCSKSCAAKKRTKKESCGDFSMAKASRRYQGRVNDRRVYSISDICDLNFDPSWDAHKDYF